MALQKRARCPGRPGCIGVKCHSLDEPNVLNQKKNPRKTPHGADYLHNSPRHMRTVLHSDSKGLVSRAMTNRGRLRFLLIPGI